MYYRYQVNDILAAKVLIDTSKEAILRRFLEIELESVELIEEIPQEIVSIKRSDFPYQFQ
jgi:hypothetical protein